MLLPKIWFTSGGCIFQLTSLYFHICPSSLTLSTNFLQNDWGGFLMLLSSICELHMIMSFILSHTLLLLEAGSNSFYSLVTVHLITVTSGVYYYLIRYAIIYFCIYCWFAYQMRKTESISKCQFVSFIIVMS